MIFDIMINRIFDHEGALSLNPLDKGNWANGRLKGTKYGISARAYPHVGIKTLTIEQAKHIYYMDFYLPLKPAYLDSAVAFQLLDYAVNSGTRRATKALQKACQVKADGVMGSITCDAAQGFDSQYLLMLILAHRLEHMSNLSVWKTFSKGWAKRIATNLRFAAKDSE